MKKNKDIEELFTFTLPEVDGLENIKLPSPEMVNFWRNYKNRVLCIEDTIGDNITEFIKMIVYFNYEDKDLPIEERKPIKIYCYSYGGDTGLGMALIDCIENSKTPIWIFNMGLCASMAALIFMAGHKRFAMPRSQFLIHQGSIAGMQGQTTQVFEAVENMKKNEEEIKKYVLGHTKISSKLYTKNAKVEWYVKADEALKLGICDEIVKDIDLLY